MKKLIFALTALFLAHPLSRTLAADSSHSHSHSNSGWQQQYAQLLKKYDTLTGVRYAAWKKDKRDLDKIQAVVDAIAHTKTKGMSKDDQMAFYINAYNAWILHEALLKYPTSSVKDLFFRFFLDKKIIVSGQRMSFNHLEKSIIRSKFKTPLVHFALNCASRSCPALYNKPYTGKDIHATLESRAADYVNSESSVRVTKDGVELSMIFKWYKDDFKKEGGVIAFINKYRKTPLPKHAKISYQDYNWDINKAE